uniref:ZT_dimer domain-containing protein n=1 Tax=Rhabditophanes sp. KR3021 TaxID=114890 RepID=A0AC35UGA5_9BILA
MVTNDNISINTISSAISEDEIRPRRKETKIVLCCDPDTLIETKPTATSIKAEKVLILVSCLTLVFIGIEVTGGILSGSLAILTDAFHMISDLAGFLISIIAIRMARRKPTSKYSFGFYRAEIIGAMASIVLIYILTTALIIMAAERIYNNDFEVDANTMLITASAGVVFNLIMAAVLHFGNQSHSHFGMSHSHKAEDHGHSHGGSEKKIEKVKMEKKGKKDIDPEHLHEHRNSKSHLTSESDEDDHGHSHGKNLNIQAAFVHVFGDLLQSFGVLIAGLIIKFTGYGIADPICTFFFSILVLFTTAHVIRDIVLILMEATPAHINHEEVKQQILRCNDVTGLHSLRLWSLSMEKIAVSVHVETTDDAAFELVISDVTKSLKRNNGFWFITVQVSRTSTPSDTMSFEMSEISVIDPVKSV